MQTISSTASTRRRKRSTVLMQSSWRAGSLPRPVFGPFSPLPCAAQQRASPYPSRPRAPGLVVEPPTKLEVVPEQSPAARRAVPKRTHVAGCERAHQGDGTHHQGNDAEADRALTVEGGL